MGHGPQAEAPGTVTHARGGYNRRSCCCSPTGQLEQQQVRARAGEPAARPRSVDGRGGEQRASSRPWLAARQASKVEVAARAPTACERRPDRADPEDEAAARYGRHHPGRIRQEEGGADGPRVSGCLQHSTQEHSCTPDVGCEMRFARVFEARPARQAQVSRRRVGEEERTALTAVFEDIL